MDAETPIRRGTEAFHANTSWYVKWNMRWTVKSRSCEVIDITARINVTITLPKWVGYGNAGSRDKREWDRFYQILVAHENGHKALAVEAGEKVEQEILSMGPKENCTLLKRAANRLGQKIIEEYNARSERYDRETDHGKKPGAKIP